MKDGPDVSDVIHALATGLQVEWDAVDSPPADRTLHGVLRQLRVIGRIAEVHGTATRLALDASAGKDIDNQPKRWGSLTLLEHVGRGSFGDVYRAWDPRLEREVALKLLPSAACEDDERATSIIEEARLLARLRHPNVATVYGADRIDGRTGLWMEFIDGRDLEQIVQDAGPLSPRDVCEIGLQLSDALAAVHGAGVLHRDIKASNVRRTDDGRVVLLDFGSGRPFRTNTKRPSDLIGTPLYLAPELLTGSPATERTDIYSLGVLLYHVLTGAYPVAGATLDQVRDAHVNSRRKRLPEASPTAPKRLADVIDRAIDANAPKRYERAADLRRALEGVAPRRPRPARAAAVAAVAAAVVLIAGVVAGTALWRRSSPSAQSRLQFQPHDQVLIARFENRTGEPVFDGAVEYALERELTSSDVVGLMPRERVEDALRLMKRPADTVVDRAIGREVCVRDGKLKVLLVGRIEKFGTNYELTAQLVDPSDDSVVATIGEEAAGQQAVLAALRRQASRVRLALGEQRDHIRGADPNIEPGATRSLRAFQLYNQSYQLGRQGRWPAALEVARQVVVADQEFASGWIWLAWSVVNAELGGSEKASPGDPRFRPFAERAVRLADSVPEWERYWITGSYYTLTQDYARAVPQYEALLRLRPDHYYAVNNLTGALIRLDRPQEVTSALLMMADQRRNDPEVNGRAAAQLLVENKDWQSAKPYMDRLRALSAAGGGVSERASFYLGFTTAYGRWQLGDVPGTLDQINRIAETVEDRPESVSSYLIYEVMHYYLALGRLADAKRYVAALGARPEKPVLALLLAIGADNLTEQRRLLAITANSPSAHIRAGLLDEARDMLAHHTPHVTAEADDDVARGSLFLATGQAKAAIPYLQRGLKTLGAGIAIDYYDGCRSLANALDRVRRQSEAVTALQTCAKKARQPVAGWVDHGFFKMRVDLSLASLYRDAGRLGEAETIEQRLRAQLAVADENFWMLQELKRRQSSTHPHN